VVGIGRVFLNRSHSGTQRLCSAAKEPGAGSRVIGHPWPARDWFILDSLADAEGREDLAKQVVVAVFAGYLAEVMLGDAQLLGGEFAGARLREDVGGGVDARVGVLECSDVAGARGERAGVAVPRGAGVRLQRIHEQFEAGARVCGQADAEAAVPHVYARRFAVEVDLVADDDARGGSRRTIEQEFVFVGVFAIGHQDGDIGPFELDTRATHAFALDGVTRFAQAGGVDQRDGDSIELDSLAQHVACGAGDFGDDRALAL